MSFLQEFLSPKKPRLPARGVGRRAGRMEDGDEGPCWCDCSECCDGESCCGRSACCGFDLCGAICLSLSWFTLGFCSVTVVTVLEDVPKAVTGVYMVLVGNAMAALWNASMSSPGYLGRGIGKATWKAAKTQFAEEALKRFQDRREKTIQDNARIEQDPNSDRGKRSVMSDKEINFRVERALEKYRRKVRFCKVCESYKPDGTHHCSVCKRCVARMDHHCPWVNNCVGRDNLRFFILFLFYVGLASTASLSLFAYRSYMVITDRSLPAPGDREPPSPWGLVMCILSVVLCLFFLIFVVAMSCEQYDAVTSGIPGIDSMQDEGEDENLSLYKGLKKYACSGKPLSIFWFLPFHWAIPRSQIDIDKKAD